MVFYLFEVEKTYNKDKETNNNTQKHKGIEGFSKNANSKELNNAGHGV